jgi:acid phosphatase
MTQVTHLKENDLGLLWVNHAAEYEALSRQVYQAATDALPVFIDDRSWTVVPGNPDYRDLPPAVILDVDETTVSNRKFQISFTPPVTQLKIDTWNREHIAEPVPGVVEFVRAARDAGVETFFVTNRPCVKLEGDPRPCPYKDTIVADLAEIGIETDPDKVMLAREKDGWDRAKIARREHIAESYRVVMLIGDDLGDFVPCVRIKLYGPCARPATAEDRRQYLVDHRELWGNGWYILPNPMHGSWTKFAE